MQRGDVVETEHGVAVMLGTSMPGGLWRGREMGAARIEDGTSCVVQERDVRLLCRPDGWDRARAR